MFSVTSSPSELEAGDEGAVEGGGGDEGGVDGGGVDRRMRPEGSMARAMGYWSGSGETRWVTVSRVTRGGARERSAPGGSSSAPASVPDTRTTLPRMIHDGGDAISPGSAPLRCKALERGS
jgi:hypothetical protein